MIKSITYENIIILLRREIAKQSGISLDRIFNATSVRGPDLYKIISETAAASFDLSNAFIVFELLEDDIDSNTVTHELDETISSISSFKFNLEIYGNACHTVSQNILMRFKTEEVSLGLRAEGIRVYRVGFPTTINEFINNTVWPRCDMSIYLQVRFNVPRITDSGYAEEINSITEFTF